MSMIEAATAERAQPKNALGPLERIAPALEHLGLGDGLHYFLMNGIDPDSDVLVLGSEDNQCAATLYCKPVAARDAHTGRVHTLARRQTILEDEGRLLLVTDDAILCDKGGNHPHAITYTSELDFTTDRGDAEAYAGFLSLLSRIETLIDSVRTDEMITEVDFQKGPREICPYGDACLEDWTPKQRADYGFKRARTIL